MCPPPGRSLRVSAPRTGCLRYSPWCAAVLATAMACASAPAPPARRYEFFGPADPASGDPWYAAIERWQQRARSEGGSLGRAGRIPGAPGTLGAKIDAFRRLERRELADRVMRWAQSEAWRHYRPEQETGPDDDPWPTFGELLARDGDDCDGLDLIVFELLRDLGFRRGEIYRAILRRARDGENHMVTLWFDDSSDPWVVDATGAVTERLRRLSDLPGWIPTKLFDEEVQWTVLAR